MKFQVKALVAALAVIASVPAQAAMDANTTANGGSLILTVFDRAANVTAAFDLGMNYTDFSVIGQFADSNVDAKGTSFSWNLAAGDYAAAWSAFLPLVNPSNLQWAVLSSDNIGSGAGSRGMIGTLNQATVTPITTNPLIAQVGTHQNYVTEAQWIGGLYQNHTTVDNGANVSNISGLNNFVGYFGGGKPNVAGSVVVGAIDTSMAVYQQVSGSSAFGATSSQIFENDAAFRLTSSGELTYVTAAVPEADSWAMMLLGLGFMGFAARRKQA